MSNTLSPTDAYGLALQLYRDDRLRDSGKVCVKILEAEADHYGALHLLGVIAHRQNKSVPALELLERALAIRPDDAEALKNYGAVLRKAGRCDDAIAALRRAIAQRPGYAAAYNNLGLALGEAGRHEEAVEALQQALGDQPEDLNTLSNLAVSLRCAGRADEAVRILRDVLARNRRHVDACNNLGVTFRTLGRIQDAAKCFETALDLQPDHPSALVNLGSMHRVEGRQELALTLFQRAARAHPDNAAVQMNLGLVLQDLDRAEEAAPCFERAVELDPSLSGARHMLAAARGLSPAAPPEGYVRELFDSYAARFDDHLVKTLRYETPQHLSELLARHADGPFRHALDLGCGTGLMGALVHGRAARLSGVDLSQRMVDEARGKAIYDTLQVGDIVSFLEIAADRFDLFVAADVLIYLGALDPLFAAVRRAALPGALFLFSTENHEDEGFVLRATGRYAHARSYVTDIAERAGFRVMDRESRPLRLERSRPVHGDLYLLVAP